MKVFEFLYTDCTYESAYATISIHKTRKGAEMAMEFHKNEIKARYEKMDEEYKEDFDWDFPLAWAIRETEVQ